MPDNFDIGISCDSCGDQTNKSMRWIRNNDELLCGCGRQIRLDADLFRSQVARIEQSFAGFQQSFSSPGN